MSDHRTAQPDVTAVPDAVVQCLHPDGSPAEVLLVERVELASPAGVLVPQYEPEDPRRQRVQPVELHPGGGLKAVSLQEKAVIETPVGPMAAERVTFHPGGQLRRVFPLDGKISAYWSVENETALAGPQRMETPIGVVSARIISVHFFPSGALRSVTLWPGERVTIATPQGPASVSVGFSFHESGALRSFEPDAPFEARTPVGTVLAFDTDPEGGMAADLNSLQFDEAGNVTALTTATDKVVVTCKAVADAGPGEDGGGGNGPNTSDPSMSGAAAWPACCPDCARWAAATGRQVRQPGRLALGPGFRESLCGTTPTDLVPLRMGFTADAVSLDGHAFSRAGHGFSVLRGLMPVARTTYSC
ncbi:hypothetical protein [Nitratidesulfovibrio sp. SRB-5]|uniref:hypothetical protein n=1 Tax=Nitratidesulfovibrio sp. SRB-5 TaxID=2872636 RepID=UPI001025DD54|nr:hypothetical protein [Nitratidesulfovibrio sp. SRB-5]MBZ2170488.1 hypothetical protein [Nitratidesulfovibrio sp. SRB-5]RXF78025.1 hypothetical protein EKK70_03660 [Desulfovibrio sp. DS-1]